MLAKFRIIVIFGLFVYLSKISMVTAETEEDIQSARHNFPLAEQLSSTKLEKKRDKYLADRGWRIGNNVKNGENFYIGWGQADVKQNPNSVRFIDSKVVAFESALLTAKGEFTRLSESRIATETVQEFFSDELNRNVDSSSGSTIEQIGDQGAPPG